MARILVISKPVVPPWNDSSKNLVRDLVSRFTRHHATVLGKQGVDAALGARVSVDALYPAQAGKYAPGLVDNARVLKRLLVGARGDVWHFFFAPNPRSSRVGAFASAVRRVPTVQTVCSAPAQHVDPRRVLFADKTIVLSRHTERRFLNAGVAASRLLRIAPCVPDLSLMQGVTRHDARVRLSLSADAPLVVYPGDLEFGQGGERAIHAYAALPATLGARLIMACRAKTPHAHARQQALQALCAQMGIADRVTWLGETREIHTLLLAADLVTLPTDTLYAKMDLPLVLLEAMALGRAVLVAQGTPAEELGEGGAVCVSEPTQEALAHATKTLLEDTAGREALERRAQLATQQKYNPETMAAAYEAVYDGLIA